jgi:hypothetical protein
VAIDARPRWVQRFHRRVVERAALRSGGHFTGSISSARHRFTNPNQLRIRIQILTLCLLSVAPSRHLRRRVFHRCGQSRGFSSCPIPVSDVHRPKISEFQ